MVALVLPHPTIEAIEAHYATNRQERKPQRLNARLLAHNCERHGWYAFRWAHEPSQFAAHFTRANMARKDAMNELGQYLADAGIAVQRVDPKTYQAMTVTAANGHYRQKIAGTAKGLLEAPATEHLLYLDQQSAKVWGQIVKHGVGAARPDRVAAIQVGMHLLGLTRTFYMVRNKDTDELWSERIEVNVAHAAALVAKAERVTETEVPPLKVSDDPDWFECRFCPAKDICHAGSFALRNCRTCLHSTVRPEGVWTCNRHEIELSIEEQERGCPHHLYLPGFVPGTPDDADEASETVTYVLADGRLWVDGEGRAA